MLTTLSITVSQLPLQERFKLSLIFKEKGEI